MCLGCLLFVHYVNLFLMPKRKIRINLSSFTLVELLIVVVIIGILSGLTLAVIDPAKFMERARDTNRQRDISILSEALGQYYADNNAYPNVADYANLGTLLTGTGGTTPTYIKTMPVDPGDHSYCYIADTNRQNYAICAELESSAENLNNISRDGATGISVRTCYGLADAPPVASLYYCTQNPF